MNMAFLDIFGKSKKKGFKQETDYYKEITNNKINLFLIPNKNYQNELLNITKSVADRFGKILYVSLNKPTEKIVEILKENNIDNEKFLFIDANKKVKETIAYHNFVFINSPKEFKIFEIGLNKILDIEKLDCLIFDSLSTLLIYQDDNAVTKFVHDLIAKLVLAKANGEFTCLLEDVDSALVKDIAMFVDKVIDISEDKEVKPESNRNDIIAKLEKELRSIKQAYASKLISEASYLKTKERLENKLKSLRKRI